ncbi:MAG: hypothetical protein AAGH15_04895 [Myxococcota bacterium]
MESLRDAGAPDGGAPDGGADDPTYLAVQRVRTPDSRSVLLSLLPNLDARTLDRSRALEVSGFSRATAFGGKVFVFDGESGVVTRYAVSSGRDFVEEARLSFASFGIVAFSTSFAFASPTRAFYFDLTTAQLLVWDPAAMAIVGAVPVPEAQRDDLTATSGGLVQVAGEILAPVSWRNTAARELVPAVVALVFSAEDGRLLRVDESEACAISAGVVPAGDDTYYLVGDAESGIFDLFGDEPLPPPCAVPGRVGVGLDESATIDLRALTGAPYVSGALGAGVGRFVTQAYDADIDPESLTNPFTFGAMELWRFAVVDLGAGRIDIADALPLSRIAFATSAVDGEPLVSVVRADSSETTVYRLTEGGPVESVTGTGDVQRIVRVR